MNLEKLKDTARKHEQKEDWRKAIDVYQKAIQHFEAGRESELDLALYNRVGDLYLKLNDPGSAVQSYERAAELYGEQGFLNNAIALCGKILRVNPGRVQTYLRLAHLHARKNVVSESKRNLIEYLERMNTLGKLEEAFQQVKRFADQHAGNQELRFMLVELLRAASRGADAQEQLERMAAELETRGDRDGARMTRERMQGADAAPGGGAAPAGERGTKGGGDLIFIETGLETPSRGRTPPPEPVAGLETTVEPAAPAPAETAPVEGLDTFAPPAEPEEAAEAPMLADLEPGAFEDANPDRLVERAADLDGLVLDGASDLSEALPDDGLDLTATPGFDVERNFDDELVLDASPGASLDLDPTFDEAAPSLEEGVPSGFDLLPDTDLERSVEAPGPSLESGRFVDEFDVGESIELESKIGGDLDFIETAGPAFGAAEEIEAFPPSEMSLESAAGEEVTSGELEERILDDPENPALHRALADVLVGEGDPSRAVEEYALAMAGYEAAGSWDSAMDVVDALLRLEPDVIKYQQKRVELAYRSGDRHRLLGAYLDLADALVRAGAADKALAVYGRILEHDPDNARARDAMAWLEPAPDAGIEAPEAESRAGVPPAVPPVVSPALDAVLPAAAPAPPAEPEPSPAPRRSQLDDFIDLGSMVLEEEGPRDTRMKVETERPTGDEQKDFQETLEQFKKGIEANLGTEDYEAHYDLGVAFKEMGLLDEAIAEFQKALRAPNGRLRTSEALGVTFVEKGQFAIAETILRRAVDALPGGDDEKIGLLYWLGRACESQGKAHDARSSYERALAVDIRFMDLNDRIQRLGTSA